MFIVSTDLDSEWSARAHSDIVPDEREETPAGRIHCVQLQCPLYVLVAMNRTKVSAFDGVESGVIPLTPLTRTFAVASANGERFPFANYRV